MLLGQFKHRLDGKGRIIIPARFRNKLTEQVIISKGFDGCLVIRSYDEFMKWQEQILATSDNLKDSRVVQRQIFANSLDLKIDKTGRINIDNNFLRLSNITDEVMVIGLINRLEIWELKQWEDYLNKNSDLEQAAQNLIKNSIEGSNND